MVNRFFVQPATTMPLPWNTIEELIGHVLDQKGHRVSHSVPVSKSNYVAAMHAARGAALAALTHSAGLTDSKHIDQVLINPERLDLIYSRCKREESNPSIDGPVDNVWIKLRDVTSVEEAMRTLNNCPGRLEIRYENIFRVMDVLSDQSCNRYWITGLPQGSADKNGWGAESKNRVEAFLDTLEPYISQHHAGV